MNKSFILAGALFSFTALATIVLAQVQSFNDVPQDHWAHEAIHNGLWTGYEDNTFGLGQNITREETAMVIHRLMEQIEARSTQVGTMQGQMHTVTTT